MRERVDGKRSRAEIAKIEEKTQSSERRSTCCTHCIATACPLMPPQIEQLGRLQESGVSLQKDQLEKIASYGSVLKQQQTLRFLYPDAFLALTDGCARHSPEDMLDSELSLCDAARCGGDVRYGGRAVGGLPCRLNNFQGVTLYHLRCLTDDPSFHRPLPQNERRNAKMLLQCHHFDLDSAKAAAGLAASSPHILLAKCESHPSKYTLCCATYLMAPTGTHFCSQSASSCNRRSRTLHVCPPTCSSATSSPSFSAAS